MPAELTYREDGSAALAVAEWPAWHSEGTVTVGRRISKEEAPLLVPEWFAEVDARPVYGQVGGQVVELPDHVLHVRTATHAPDGTPVPEKQVGLVGRHRYQLVQPATTFEMAEHLQGLREVAEVASIGLLREGSVAFVTLYMGDAYLIPGEDAEQFGRYLNIFNSYDASYALTATNSDVKIVCMNTLRWNAKQAERAVKVRHTGDMEARLVAARSALGMADRYAALQAAMAEHLAERKVDAQEFFHNLVPLPLDKAGQVQEGRALTNANQLREVLQQLHDTHPTVQHIRGTEWGALSTVTLYTNHLQGRRTTRTGTADDNRFEALVMDASSPLETRAQGLLQPPAEVMRQVLARAKDRMADLVPA